MILSFSPVRSDQRLQLERQDDCLTINGTGFDFAPLPEGASLNPSAIDSPWISGPVTRRDGHLHLTLLLPHGPHAPRETLFPEPLHVTENGPIPLPPHNQEKT